ncbi:MAG: ribosomal L7Ae/L30e/S12e/Gadd45 family protein [Candidatus Nanohaloarchaeota archaeon QJJ-7]|nr:ribosomal L7Ae/L30e/S12e/Gadd45 family protein [Candidatus Nanohaloarchaeota archaeon QJJ-7]
MSIDKELQEAAETGSLVVGTDETIKHIDSLDRIVLASNVPEDIEDEVRGEAGDGTDIEMAEVDNQELGSLCMKPFSASVVGIE